MKTSNASNSQQNNGMGFKPSYWLIGVVVIVLVAAAALVLSQPAPTAAPASLPAEINVAQAAEKRNAGAFILDVREPSEWNEAHIPGSTLIPLAELQSRMSEVPKDRPVVVVCRSGNRSATGRDYLKQAGFTQVTSMGGGLNQWMTQNMPVVAGP